MPPEPSATPLDREHLLKLAVIGTCAGAFSGLLGVGGGTVIVPLLILWLAYGEREATGTSMMAIIVIAAYAVIAQLFHHNVDVAKAALVGIPAVGGAVLGTAIQQRIPERTVSLIFGILLLFTAGTLVIR
jgi:uncharacterized protein